MHRVRHYEIEGVLLEIPQHYDEQSGIYIEEYPDFVENPVWTKEGHPIMFAGEDACSDAKEATPGGCPDCGSCKFYRPADVHTWIGVCTLEKRKNIVRQDE